MSEENSKPDVDEVSGTETTGHEWDGIKELDTPMPKWWLWTYWATVIWSIGYMIVYPAFPGHKGTFDYSSRAEVAAELEDAQAKLKPYMDRIASMDFADIRSDSELMNVAMTGGKAAFGDNCAPCHGTGGQGFTGFPALGDDDWLWGGAIEDIEYTIRHGIRWEEDLDTRFSEMPKFVVDGMISRDEALGLVEYVTSLSGGEHDATMAASSAQLFADQCASCHADDGSGMREQGAPDLTDALWLYGGDKDSIYQSIAGSRRGVMPAWVGRLDEATIKQLALYVHAMGGGE